MVALAPAFKLGIAFTVTKLLIVNVPLPLPLVAVRVTGNTPAESYVTVGFWRVENPFVDPGRSQYQTLGVLVLRSVKETVFPTQIVVALELVKFATGIKVGSKIVIV